MRPGIFQHVAHRALGPAHYALHPVGRTDEMALVDAGAAAHAHEYVLGVVGHADHLVGHDLPDGEDQVEGRVEQEFVDLGRPADSSPSLRRPRGHRKPGPPHRHHVVAPVVDAELSVGHVAEHRPDLLRAHRGMGAEGRHHVGEGVAEVVIDHLGDGPGEGVQAGEIRRNGKTRFLGPSRRTRPGGSRGPPPR